MTTTATDIAIGNMLATVGGGEVIMVEGDPSGVESNFQERLKSAWDVATSRSMAILVIRPGDYKKSSPFISGAFNNIAIVGGGVETTKIYDTYCDSSRFVFGDYSGGVSERFRLEGLNISGDLQQDGAVIDVRNMKNNFIGSSRLHGKQAITYGKGAGVANSVKTAHISDLECQSNSLSTGILLIDLASMDTFTSTGYLNFETGSQAYCIGNSGQQNCDGCFIDHLACNNPGRGVSVEGGGIGNLEIANFNILNANIGIFLASSSSSRHIGISNGIIVCRDPEGLGPNGQPTKGIYAAGINDDQIIIDGIKAEGLGSHIVHIANDAPMCSVANVHGKNCGRKAGGDHLIRFGGISGSVQQCGGRWTYGQRFKSVVLWSGAPSFEREGPRGSRVDAWGVLQPMTTAGCYGNGSLPLFSGAI